jgi:hypothetical protein
MAKLRLFHRINFCKDKSLLFDVFKIRKQELDTSGDLIRNITYYLQKGTLPWIYEVISVILPRYSLSDFASTNALKRLSKSRWAALVKKRTKSIVLSKLKASMILRRPAAGRVHSNINCSDVQNSYIWLFDRTSTLYNVLTHLTYSHGSYTPTIEPVRRSLILDFDKRKLCNLNVACL